jgi:hypothetical protein
MPHTRLLLSWPLPVVPALAALAALAAGCASDTSEPKECTAIGCVGGFSLDFSAPLKAAGQYTVVIDADGQQTTCQATLPFAGCSSAAPCSSGDVLLGLSGCALPTDQHSIIGLQLPSKHPARVVVTIQRDGQPVASQGFDVTYQTSRPNGPECEPVCSQASATMNTP